jgi:hypothetical protein
MDKEIYRQEEAGSRFGNSRREFTISGSYGDLKLLRESNTICADAFWAEGNSPQFDEKAGIFRGCGQRRNEAICVIMAMITAMPYDGIDKRGKWAPRTGNEILLYALY